MLTYFSQKTTETHHPGHEKQHLSLQLMPKTHTKNCVKNGVLTRCVNNHRISTRFSQKVTATRHPGPEKQYLYLHLMQTQMHHKLREKTANVNAKGSHSPCNPQMREAASMMQPPAATIQGTNRFEEKFQKLSCLHDNAYPSHPDTLHICFSGFFVERFSGFFVRPFHQTRLVLI